jgi:hypothetical protein
LWSTVDGCEEKEARSMMMAKKADSVKGNVAGSKAEKGSQKPEKSGLDVGIGGGVRSSPGRAAVSYWYGVRQPNVNTNGQHSAQLVARDKLFNISTVVLKDFQPAEVVLVPEPSAANLQDWASGVCAEAFKCLQEVINNISKTDVSDGPEYVLVINAEKWPMLGTQTMAARAIARVIDNLREGIRQSVLRQGKLVGVPAIGVYGLFLNEYHLWDRPEELVKVQRGNLAAADCLCGLVDMVCVDAFVGREIVSGKPFAVGVDFNGSDRSYDNPDWRMALVHNVAQAGALYQKGRFANDPDNVMRDSVRVQVWLGDQTTHSSISEPYTQLEPWQFEQMCRWVHRLRYASLVDSAVHFAGFDDAAKLGGGEITPYLPLPSSKQIRCMQIFAEVLGASSGELP